MISPVACVIPAYQAAATLGAVAGGLRASLPGATLIAVDDGSRDATADVARACCDQVLVLPSNRGKGAALRAGLAAALAGGARAVLTVDADGQHDPASSPALLAALDTADVALGVRARAGGAMPPARRLSNALASRAMSACAGVPLPDAQSGFRALRRAVLESVVAVGDRYEYESDFLIRAARGGFRVVGVPVATIYGAPSHFRLLQDALLVMQTIWRHRDGALQRRAAARAAGAAPWPAAGQGGSA
ncbi:MAG: glycosyltransferase family 2 protein [Gemmatimonadaceae bacterium]